MTETSFTVQTFNGHDEIAPIRSATFVGLQERGGHVNAALQLMGWYPPGLQEALLWNPLRFEVDARGKVQLHGSGRSFGRPDTTPTRWALWVGGLLDGQHRVAVINTHLVNNAWGDPIRGERTLRRRLWWLGWVKVLRLRRQLRQSGYTVFIVGDLNRTAKFWKLVRRVVGAGFDRIIYPRGVELLESWTGDAAGSDHRPLFARFRFKR